MSPKRSPGRDEGGAAPQQRVTLSEIVRAQLAALERVPREHSTVALSRNAKGLTQIEVSVRTGDEGIDTLADALELARRLYDELSAAYPIPVGAGADASAVAEASRKK